MSDPSGDDRGGFAVGTLFSVVALGVVSVVVHSGSLAHEAAPVELDPVTQTQAEAAA